MPSTLEPPKPAVASGPSASGAGHETQVQALARYAARATFDDLSNESRKRLLIHILDSLELAGVAAGI